MSTEREQALLQQLRSSNDPTALREADHLQTLYHDRQMDGLAEDVYKAAKREGDPPIGWARLSEHPELLEKYAAQLHTSAFELKRTLHPDVSGFRAEIYLPDAAMRQAGYKPTLAFKGSSGDVMTSDTKLHDTTTEDFGANNFPQSVGLETDYYDRAMNLGNLLKTRGLDFESTGHSLAGGMAAAVAAVTDTRATTFNAAGLNPVTTERFAQQNPGVIVSTDLTRLITNYQVQGELLSDGIQNNIHNMDALRRMQLAGVLKDTCDVLQKVPEARELFAQKLGDGLPPQAQQTVNAFVEKVATGDTNRMLRDLPLAVGQQHVLAAMTRDAQGQLVPREQVLSLPEATRLAAPLLESLAVISTGAHVAQRGGEVVAAAGLLHAQELRATGLGVDGAADALGAAVHAVTRTEGAVALAGEHAVGAVLAQARVAQAEAAAQMDQGLAQAKHLGAEVDAAMLRGVSHLLPGQAQHALQAQATRPQQAGLEAQQQAAATATTDRQAGQADAALIHGATQAVEMATLKGTEAYGAAQHAVIDGAGHYARAPWDAAAQGIENVSRHAPSALAATGAAAGLGAATIFELRPSNYPALAGAATAINQGLPAVSEALDRHLMIATVTPSMDAHVQSRERQAEQILQRAAPEYAPVHEPSGQRHAEPSHAPAPSHSSMHGHTPAADQARARAVPDGISPLRDFSDPKHPQNALYNTLKAGFPPDTTPEWLAHATATCYMSGIRQPNDLGNVVGNGENIVFMSQSLFSQSAVMNTTQSPPAVQQTMQHVQQFDQQQTQMMSEIRTQNAQINAQAQQGPMMGGPMR
ncbi:MAG: phospholipase [Rhodanobacter sp.]